MALPCGVLSEKNRPRTNGADFTVRRLDVALTRQVYGQDSLRCWMPVANPARWDAFKAVLGCGLEVGEQHRWGVLEVVVDFLEGNLDILEVRLSLVIDIQAQKVHKTEPSVPWYCPGWFDNGRV